MNQRSSRDFKPPSGLSGEISREAYSGKGCVNMFLHELHLKTLKSPRNRRSSQVSSEVALTSSDAAPQILHSGQVASCSASLPR